MLTLTLAALSSTVAIAFSARCFLRVLGGGPRETEGVLARLPAVVDRDTDLSGVVEQLARAGCPISADVAPYSRITVIDAWNDHVADVDGLLQGAVRVPFVASRVALFTGTFGAVLELPRLLAGRETAVFVLLPFAAGALGALVCWDLGGRTQARSEAVRREWDRIGGAISRLLPGSAEGTGHTTRRVKTASLVVPQ